MRLLKKLGKWIRRMWFFYLASNPIPESPLPVPEVPKATDVMNEYDVVEFHGQRINLHIKTEKPKWDRMNREQKRKVAQNWTRMEKKGEIKFEDVNGKLICVRNLNYNARAQKEAEKHERHEL